MEKVQFNGASTHANQIISWISGRAGKPPEGGIHPRDIIHIRYESLHGTINAAPGDWVVKDDNGKFHVEKKPVHT